MYTIHATEKLLDRVRQPIGTPVNQPSTALGNWYATGIFWKPQVALFVNEATLLPVLVPLAPAAELAERFPEQLGRVLDRLGTPPEFVFSEVGAMTTAVYAKTANRSVVGSMVDFEFLAGVYRNHESDLVKLSARLAGVPCAPLRNRGSFPDRALAAVVTETLGDV